MTKQQLRDAIEQELHAATERVLAGEAVSAPIELLEAMRAHLDGPSLEVDDRMRMSVKLIETMNEPGYDMLVRVKQIETADDGSKTVWVEKAHVDGR